MRYLADSPLRKKLIWLAMTCSIVALLTTAVSLGAYEWVFYRKLTYSHLGVLTAITARNSAAALALANSDEAERIIAALDAEPAIVAAALYDESGHQIAGFRHRDSDARVLIPTTPPEDGVAVVNGYFRIVSPVIDARRFGTLLVLADVREIRERAAAYGIVLLCTTIVSGVLAYLLVGWLKERIVEPVQALATAAAQVQTEADYSVRVHRQTNDEFGALTDAFNAMLARIQQNEAELARAAERLRIAVDSARVGTWDWDLVHDVILWNDRQYELFRVPRGTTVNAALFLANVHSDDRQKLQDAIGSAASGEDFSIEVKLCPPDAPKEVRHVVLTGRTLAVPDGQVQRAIGVTLDVTERRLTELKLIESEVRFRAVAERVPAMVWSCDAGLSRDYFNKTWLAFTGRPLERELGTGWQDSVLGLDLQRWQELVGGAAAQRDPYSIEYRIRRADGAVRWLIETGSPRFAPDGTFTGYLGSCIDITARKETEEELEMHVRLRTRDLQAANQDLESFSYSVSHDLRGPLRAIQGFAEIAIEEIDANNPGSAKERISRVLRATARMNRLNYAFISMARITRAELRVEPVDLGRIADDVFGFLRSTSPERRVEVSIAPGLKARGDERLLRIAIENLLSNAWKFTSRATAARIEFGSETQDGERVFFVRDNGAGFDETLGHKLFHAFERLHPEAEYAGLGVGLSTVHRVIEKHDGRVWARSNPGEGATFYFTLPESAGAPV